MKLQIPTIPRKIKKYAIIGASLLLVLTISAAVYMHFFGMKYLPLVINNKGEDIIIQLSSDNISKQKVVQIFGVNNVVYVSDRFFRLKLNDNTFPKLTSANIPYISLSDNHPETYDSYSLWHVKIKEPVYSQKVQTLAIYGIIVSQNNNDFLLWTSKNKIEGISALVDVESVVPYYNYEKIDPQIANVYSQTDKFSMRIYLLINNNNLVMMQSTISSLGMNITKQSDKSFIGQSLEAIYIDVDAPSSQVDNLLNNIPQIVNISPISD